MDQKIEIFDDQTCNISPWFNRTLIEAMKNKDYFKFRNVVKKLDLKDLRDARDCKGASLLHLAAECDSEDIPRYLIKLKFNINSQNAEGQTALMVALKKQNFNTANILLESNADICAYDNFGMTALQIAISTGPVTSYDVTPWSELLKYLQIFGMLLNRLDRDCSSDSQKIADQLLQMECPLTHVVFMDNLEVMKIMIAKGSPINLKDCYSGQTPLHLAIQCWKIDKVKILLDCGADFNCVDYSLNTPMMCIYDNNHFRETTCEVEFVKLLVKHKRKLPFIGDHDLVQNMYPIFRYGSKDAISTALIESKEDLLLARDESRLTLLHVIAMNSNPKVEQAIRGKKIDVNSRNSSGQTALSIALMHGNFNIAEHLFDEGACLRVRNNRGISLIHRLFLNDFCSNSRSEQQRLEFIIHVVENGSDIEYVAAGDITILDIIYPKNEYFLGELVLAHFALRTSLGIPMPRVIEKQIQTTQRFRKYFDSCVNLLIEAKATKINKSMTIFELLTANNQQISFYARNRSLVSNLSKLNEQFTQKPHYTELFQKRISKILHAAELREKAEEIIRENIGVLYKYNDIVTQMIVKYLNDEDLKILCKN